MFGREFAQLDLKIAEESPFVDQIIVVEASKTHANLPKPFFLRNRYNDPKVKIVEIGEEFTDQVWHNEPLQRNISLPACLEDNDVVIYGDDDEINHGEEIPFIVDQAKKYQFVKLQLSVYHYKINLRCNNPDVRFPFLHADGPSANYEIVPNAPCQWIWSFAATGEFIRKSGLTLTQLRYKSSKVIATKGQHFSYLGGPEEVAFKIRNSLHNLRWNIPAETDYDMIEQRIKKRVSRIFEHPIKLIWVPVDDTYPKTMLENLNAWADYIEPKPKVIFL